MLTMSSRYKGVKGLPADLKRILTYAENSLRKDRIGNGVFALVDVRLQDEE